MATPKPVAVVISASEIPWATRPGFDRPARAKASNELIIPDTEGEADKWVEINSKYAAEWPNITQKIDPMPDADKLAEEKGKYDKFFSDKPGEGS